MPRQLQAPSTLDSFVPLFGCALRSATLAALICAIGARAPAQSPTEPSTQPATQPSTPPATRAAAGQPPAQSNDDGQWTMPGKNYQLTRYSGLDQINTQNAKDLRVAWTFSTAVNR